MPSRSDVQFQTHHNDDSISVHLFAIHEASSCARLFLIYREVFFLKPPETIEEELAIISDALAAGIDPFKPINNHSRVGKSALGWFLILLMLSWVSQILYHSV